MIEARVDSGRTTVDAVGNVLTLTVETAEIIKAIYWRAKTGDPKLGDAYRHMVTCLVGDDKSPLWEDCEPHGDGGALVLDVKELIEQMKGDA